MFTLFFCFEDTIKHSTDSHSCSCLFRHSSETQRYGTWKVFNCSDFTVWWQCYILQIHCTSKFKTHTSTAVWTIIQAIWEKKKRARDPELFLNFSHLEWEKQKSYLPPHGCQARKVSFQHRGCKGTLCRTKQKELQGDPALAAWKDFQFSFLQLRSEHPLDQGAVTQAGMWGQQLVYCLFPMQRCGVRPSISPQQILLALTPQSQAYIVLAAGNTAHPVCPWQEAGTRWTIKSLPAQAILWFCDSV